MMPVLDFSGVIMLGGMLDSYHSTQGNNLLLNSPMHLLERLIYLKKCLSLTQASVLQVKMIVRTSLWVNFNSSGHEILFWRKKSGEILYCFCKNGFPLLILIIHLFQLMKLSATPTWHLSMISMRSLFVQGLSVLTLSNHLLLKKISRSSSGGKLWTSIQIQLTERDAVS